MISLAIADPPGELMHDHALDVVVLDLASVSERPRPDLVLARESARCSRRRRSGRRRTTAMVSRIVSRRPVRELGEQGHRARDVEPRSLFVDLQDVRPRQGRAELALQVLAARAGPRWCPKPDVLGRRFARHPRLTHRLVELLIVELRPSFMRSRTWAYMLSSSPEMFVPRLAGRGVHHRLSFALCSRRPGSCRPSRPPTPACRRVHLLHVQARETHRPLSWMITSSVYEPSSSSGVE